MNKINYNRKIAREIRELKQDSRFIKTIDFIQHGNTSVYEHSVKVAVLSCYIASKLKMKVDYISLIRGALLHDYFLYDWHNRKEHEGWHGFRHPRKAWKNAKEDFELNRIEEDIILKHMFPLVPFFPRYRESWIICIADKISAIYETIYEIKLLYICKKLLNSIGLNY